MNFKNMKKKVLNSIEEKELTDLAVKMGNIYSPAGDEKNMGNFVYDWLNSNGFNASKQVVTENRFNVISKLDGSMNNKAQSLLFNSHMDSDVGCPGDEWAIADYQSPHYNKAWIEGDKIFGKQVLNDRGPMAAFMIAAKAIKNSGIKLKGDLLLSMVVGEIGMAPVDEYQGPIYLGKGLGSRYLVDHGIITNHVLVAETTDFGITWIEAGAAYIKITLKGEAIYTPRSFRTEKIEEHPNAIVKMAKLIHVLEKWGIDFEKENTVEFDGGVLVPKVAIGAIRGGIPYKPFRTSGVCSVYVDVRIPPGMDIIKIKTEIKKIVESINMEADIQIYLYRPGYEGKKISDIVNSTKESYKKIFKEYPKKIPTEITSMWRDINVFNEKGIPAITFGPPRNKDIDIEGNKISYLLKEDLVNTAKIYTLIAMDICNR